MQNLKQSTSNYASCEAKFMQLREICAKADVNTAKLNNKFSAIYRRNTSANRFDNLNENCDICFEKKNPILD